MIVKEETAEHEEMDGRIAVCYVSSVAYDQSVFSDGIVYAGKTG